MFLFIPLGDHKLFSTRYLKSRIQFSALISKYYKQRNNPKLIPELLKYYLKNNIYIDTSCVDLFIKKLKRSRPSFGILDYINVYTII